jgi:hypothetical protein
MVGGPRRYGRGEKRKVINNRLLDLDMRVVQRRVFPSHSNASSRTRTGTACASSPTRIALTTVGDAAALTARCGPGVVSWRVLDPALPRGEPHSSRLRSCSQVAPPGGGPPIPGLGAAWLSRDRRQGEHLTESVARRDEGSVGPSPGEQGGRCSRSTRPAGRARDLGVVAERLQAEAMREK